MNKVDLNKIVFDLSQVTVNEAINIPALDLEGVVEYFDKITPGIDMFELPFNLFPIVLARYKDYIESFVNLDNVMDQLKDYLEDMDEEDERDDGDA